MSKRQQQQHLLCTRWANLDLLAHLFLCHRQELFHQLRASIRQSAFIFLISCLGTHLPYLFITFLSTFFPCHSPPAANPESSLNPRGFLHSNGSLFTSKADTPRTGVWLVLLQLLPRPEAVARFHMVSWMPRPVPVPLREDAR